MSVLSVEIASVLALGAFAAHTVLPDGGSVAHFFDYRLYYAIIVVAAGLTIARAAVSPLHRGAWIALAAAVSSYATAEFIWLFLYSSNDNPPYPVDRGRVLPGLLSRRATSACSCCSAPACGR